MYERFVSTILFIVVITRQLAKGAFKVLVELTLVSERIYEIARNVVRKRLLAAVFCMVGSMLVFTTAFDKNAQIGSNHPLYSWIAVIAFIAAVVTAGLVVCAILSDKHNTSVLETD